MMARSVIALMCVASLVALSSRSRASAQERAGVGAARVSQLVRSVETAGERVQRLLASARGGGDPTRVMCVDARLSEIHSVMRLVLERSERLNEAARRGDRLHADRETSVVARLADRVREIERAAHACVDPEHAVGDRRTRVTVVIEPGVPTDAVDEPAAGAIRRGAFLR
jgi:hypothetical protein